MRLLFTILALLLVTLSAHAQEKYLGIGAGCYAADVTQCKAHLSLVFPMDADGKNFSYSIFEFRGAGEQPIYSVRTGFARAMAVVGPVGLLALANGGVSTTDSATTGSMAWGGAADWKITPKLHAVSTIQMLVDPSAGGNKMQVTVGIAVPLSNP